MSKVFMSLDGAGIRATQFLSRVAEKLSKPLIVKSGDQPDLLSSPVADACSAAPIYFPTHAYFPTHEIRSKPIAYLYWGT